MKKHRFVLFVVTALVTVVVGGLVLASSGLLAEKTTDAEASRSPEVSASAGPSPDRPRQPRPNQATQRQSRPNQATGRQDTPRQDTPRQSADRRTSAAPQPSPTTPRPAGTARRPSGYAFPVDGCEATYARGHHDYPAADIFADRGCPFVAPVAGRVDELTRVDRWDPAASRGPTRGGLSVSMVGVDGVRYYGSHLDSVRDGISPGTRLRAGAVLGFVGDTGSARGTGSHLHFGISWPSGSGRWWVRRGTVPPQPYLDAWRVGSDRSPARAVAEAERAAGVDSQCRTYC